MYGMGIKSILGAELPPPCIELKHLVPGENRSRVSDDNNCGRRNIVVVGAGDVGNGIGEATCSGALPASILRQATSVVAFQRVQTPTAAKALAQAPQTQQHHQQARNATVRFLSRKSCVSTFRS